MNDLIIAEGKGYSLLEGSGPPVHFPNAFYHVIARGNRRQAIFSDEQDHQRSLSDVSEYKTRYPFHLYAYALIQAAA